MTELETAGGRAGAHYERIRYEVLEGAIAKVTMARVEKRNAQDYLMTYELDDALTRAAADDDVKVIVLAGDGPHFNAGHDQVNRGTVDQIRTVGTWFGYTKPGIEGGMARNRETYFDTCWRWRNIPKPLIAQVQGKTIGGGLMLMWICDLIVASEDATFADPVVHIGCNGVEYFSHPWELGPRKAKEMLFLSQFLSAEEARERGMVNRVVPRERLEETCLEMARKIATQPSLGLKLAKEAVNFAQDAQGYYEAMRHALLLCTIGHAQMMLVGRTSDSGYGEDFPIRSARPEAEGGAGSAGGSRH